jgi:hypothetical protein
MVSTTGAATNAQPWIEEEGHEADENARGSNRACRGDGGRLFGVRVDREAGRAVFKHPDSCERLPVVKPSPFIGDGLDPRP